MASHTVVSPLLSHKQDAERVRAAVARDGAARLRLFDGLKRSVLCRFLLRRGHDVRVRRRVGDERELRRDVLAPVKALFYILADALFKRAAVLLAHGHLAVSHLDAGLQVQKIRAQRGHSRAAAALSHVVEALDQKARLDLRRERAHALGDLRAGKALLGELRRRDDQKALAGAQILRIDHEDVLVLLRRGAGILIAAGEIRADGDLHHRVILVCVAREHLAVLVLADRRRAAKVSAAVHVGKNVGGRDVYTIVEVLAVLDDAQRRDGNIIALEQRGRQVARAVGNNLHSHRSFLPS